VDPRLVTENEEIMFEAINAPLEVRVCVCVRVRVPCPCPCPCP